MIFLMLLLVSIAVLIIAMVSVVGSNNCFNHIIFKT